MTLPSLLPSLEARLVHKADKISCTPISKRTNEQREGRRTNERERRRRFRDTKDDLPARAQSPLPPPPIPIPAAAAAASDSQWPPGSSAVSPLDGVVMHPSVLVLDGGDFFALVRRKGAIIPRFAAGMWLDDDSGGGHSHLDPFYDGSSIDRGRLCSLLPCRAVQN